MKKFFKLSLILIGLSVVFSACKKDPVDLENSYMDITEDCWVGDNYYQFTANLAPGTITEGEKVTVTYTSEADPVGITAELPYYNTTLDWGNDVYNIQKVSGTFYAAAFSNEDDYRLKVNPAGDDITITIGDNLYQETVAFDGKYDPLIVCKIFISGAGYITGSVKYYNETADRPQIEMSSNTQTTPITVNADSELGDNGYYASGETEDFGYTAYDATLVYDENDPDYPGFPEDEIVMVNLESGTFYVKIDDILYSAPLEGETLSNVLMTPVN